MDMKIPGWLNQNPSCICGYKKKRIYITHQVKTEYGTRRYRSKSKPIGWACLKCGDTEFDGGILNEN